MGGCSVTGCGSEPLKGCGGYAPDGMTLGAHVVSVQLPVPYALYDGVARDAELFRRLPDRQIARVTDHGKPPHA